ncbi:MAG TPA: ImcF-related family protein [Bryobacteraceae bacterium]|nr:ImcF-related family protein [Bryobacteraceae bacterium]
MRKVLTLVGSTLLAYLLLTFFTPNLLGLSGGKLWILRGCLWLIGIAAAAVVIWFLSNKHKEEQGAAGAEDAPSGGEEIAVLIREAEKKLGAAHLEKGARIGNLPVILVIGEPSSTKTSVVLYSGLEPELLAGQVYQDGNVTSTRSANLWFSRRTIFVEAGGKLLEDQAGRSYLVRRLQPRKMAAVFGQSGQAPRAVLVCMEAERLTAGPQAIATLARNLRAKLGEMAGLFGIQLPVYVLFTKTDRLPFFADFVRNLNKEEVTEAVGATLPIPGQSTGVWAEEQGARLGGAFDQIFRGLCNARPEFLARENDAARLPGAYEFPREFRKLRGALVQFLVDLCRPSQLAVGPFLRGFYFCGVRPVILQEAAPAPEARLPEKRSSAAAQEATGMFRMQSAGQATAAPQPQRVAVSRRAPQWLFLTRLFNDVLLADRVAMGASGSSAKTDVLRRILLVSAALFALVFCVGFSVSFVLNRGLESQADAAMRATIGAPGGSDLASVEALRRLEALRQSLQTLTTYYRQGAPMRYRWGLYVGDDLYPQVRLIYFRRFKALLFGQTQNSLVTFLDGLPPTPGPPYDQTYNSLKGYLITTSNHDKSTREFLAPLLQTTWTGTQTVDPERLLLARKQFDFYSDELRIENPFSKQNDTAAIEKARAYLKSFGDFDRVYRNMKADAPKASINFNRQYPGSASYVLDGYEVAGAFTKQGWNFMSAAIRSPDRYAKGEPWVLGDQSAAEINDHRTLIVQLLARYEADFIEQWCAYLKSARVAPYKSLRDASEKLSRLSSNESPLLALFALASQNTAVDDDVVKKTFQPVAAVVPAGGDRFIVPQNQEYMSALTKLQVSVDGVAQTPQATDLGANQTLADADAARLTTKQLAQNFNPDLQNHVDTMVQQILLEPIINTEALLRGLGPAELNAKGKDLCVQFRTAFSKYPFNPASKLDATVSDLNNILRKPDGALWQFYESNLKKILPKRDTGYVAAAGSKMNPAFVVFFNQAAAFSDAIYAAGSQEPRFTYSLRAVPTDGVQRLGLEIDAQKLDYSGGSAAPKLFTWQGSGPHGARGTLGADGISFTDEDGLWGVFRFFNAADHRDRSPSGGELLDWIPRSGTGAQPMKLPGGKPLTIRFELNMGATPHVFEKGFFARFACVAEVAKP